MKPRKITVQHIEESVPIPVRITYPLDKLEVGESFTFPASKRSSVQSRVSRIKAASGKHFTISKESEDKCRVWRVA